MLPMSLLRLFKEIGIIAGLLSHLLKSSLLIAFPTGRALQFVTEQSSLVQQICCMSPKKRQLFVMGIRAVDM